MTTFSAYAAQYLARRPAPRVHGRAPPPAAAGGADDDRSAGSEASESEEETHSRLLRWRGGDAASGAVPGAAGAPLPQLHDPFLAEPESPPPGASLLAAAPDGAEARPGGATRPPASRLSVYDEAAMGGESDGASESSGGGRNGICARRARHEPSSLLVSDFAALAGSSVRAPRWAPAGSTENSSAASLADTHALPSHTPVHLTLSAWAARSAARSPLQQPLMHDTQSPLAAVSLADAAPGPAVYTAARAAPAAAAAPPLHKWHDVSFVVLFAAAVLGVVAVDSAVLWDAERPSLSGPAIGRPSPYYALSRSVPMLVLVMVCTLGVSLAYLHALRHALRWGAPRVLQVSLVAVPALLGLAWAWAFAGSFLYDEEPLYGGAWSTTGLRLLSLVPLLGIVRMAVNAWRQRAQLAAAASQLERTLHFAAATQGALLVPLLATMLATVLVAAGALTLLAQLFLVGEFRAHGGMLLWSTDTAAVLLIGMTLYAWLWATAVVHSVLTAVVAGAARVWHRGAPAHAYDAYAAVQTAAMRACAPLLGSLCAVTLGLSLARVVLVLLVVVRAVRRCLGRLASPHAGVARVLDVLARVAASRSDACARRVLVLVGVTEADAWTALCAALDTTAQPPHLPLVRTLLSGASAACALLAGIGGFLFCAHQMHVPADSLLVAVVFAGVTLCMLRIGQNVLCDGMEALALCDALDDVEDVRGESSPAPRLGKAAGGR
ncbi:hypothetical protein MSPP1_002899 [Malassezia sp. CBS 17886]|nr:hypothetical protein MSPP1_002899 [Malassezia sp. CBS 17886]